MKKDHHVVNTQGAFSPGIVHGDFVINIHQHLAAPTAVAAEDVESADFQAPEEVLWLISAAPSEQVRSTIRTEWDRAGAGSDFDGVEVLRFIECVVPVALRTNSWGLRRVLSLVGSQALGVVDDEKVLRNAGDRIWEKANGFSGGEIFLASMFARSEQSALLFGDALGSLLSGSSEPQATWQMFKARESVPFLIRHGPRDLLIEHCEDAWCRRRLLISICANTVDGGGARRADRQVMLLADELVRMERNEEGDSFLRPFGTWQENRLGQQIIGTGVGPEGGAHKYITGGLKFCDRSGKRSQIRHRDIQNIGLIFDVGCMDFELPGARNKWAVLGHYGTIFRWIEDVLTRTHEEFQNEVLAQLTLCTDEGVRWAVARALAKHTGIDISRHSNVVQTLLRDRNSWVVREILHTLDGTASDSIVSCLEDPIFACMEDMQARKGGIESDVLSAFVQLVKNRPNLLRRIVIARKV